MPVAIAWNILEFNHMGFSTTFHISYPADPGTVTAKTIHSLVSAVAPVVECENTWRTISFRYGPNPAMSNKPFFEDVPILANLSVMESHWDVESSPDSHRTFMDALASQGNQSIHRALVTFGHLSEGETQSLSREPDENNSEGLYPYEIGLAVGPIEVGRDDDHYEVVQIGWLSLSISGNGYCFPWLHQDLIERCLTTRFATNASNALLALLGPVSANSFTKTLASCQKRTRVLPGGLIAAVEGI